MGVCVAFLLLFALPAVCASFKPPVYEFIAPGVVYAEVTDTQNRLVYHVIKADIQQHKEVYSIDIRAVKAAGKETLAQLINRLVGDRRPVLSAVNGDYFERDTDNGLTWGAHVEKGELFFSPGGNAVFMVDKKGVPLIAVPQLVMQVRFQQLRAAQPVTAVNRPRGRRDEGFYLYTKNWGQAVPVVPGGAVVHIKVEQPLLLDTLIKGEVIKVTAAGNDVPLQENEYILTCGSRQRPLVQNLPPGTAVALRGSFSGNLKNVSEAVGGGPRIVRNRKTDINFDIENFSSSHTNYLRPRHPRALLGYNKQRTLLFLVVVEGRHSQSRGLSLIGCAELMQFLGAWDAMLFDGGGSATMYLGGELVTHQGDANAAGRRIGNALVLLLNRNVTE